jgi:D-alanyl-lipoteichoic acid acyltransferase DltB (MBOAT superfamily)
MLAEIGIHPQLWTLHIILPVGISFYTFHGLSYVIDTYNKRIQPSRNIIEYSLFVSFFPLLVAGPIERATHLLPQLTKHREFDYFDSVSGLRQILWGLFKKIAIADTCAIFVDEVFNNSNGYSSWAHILAAFFFAIQIYCDFSGYSDIAIGTARLFGIQLIRNFAYPYFSRDIAEFWRRWHISLSSWFRDYVYIPLGGSIKGLSVTLGNVFVIFLLSGIWHGANWTFVVWGLINALYFLPLLISKRNRQNLNIVAANGTWPKMKELYQILLTFLLTMFAWIFFRASNVSSALSFIHDLLFSSSHKQPKMPPIVPWLILILIVFEWYGRQDQFALQRLGLRWPAPLRYALYYSLIFAILFFSGEQKTFIYFQF